MLLVSEDGPIHLRLLADTLDHQLTDLKTVVLKPGEDAFSPGRQPKPSRGRSRTSVRQSSPTRATRGSTVGRSGGC